MERYVGHHPQGATSDHLDGPLFRQTALYEIGAHAFSVAPKEVGMDIHVLALDHARSGSGDIIGQLPAHVTSLIGELALSGEAALDKLLPLLYGELTEQGGQDGLLTPATP